MKTILYVDDLSTTRWIAEEYLAKAFPSHNIVCIPSKQVLDERIETGDIKLENITIVCTDGNLGRYYGWDVAESLKNFGYKGPILYTSGYPHTN